MMLMTKKGVQNTVNASRMIPRTLDAYKTRICYRLEQLKFQVSKRSKRLLEYLYVNQGAQTVTT